MSPQARIIPLAALILAAAVAKDAAAQATYKSDPPRRAFLFKDARGEVAAARARGDTTVTLVVASMRGQNAKVAALVKKLGGTVGYREDMVDYLRVRVPVDSVESLVRSPLVHSSDVSIRGRSSRALGMADGLAGGADAAALQPSSTLPFGPDTAKRPWPPVLSDAPLVDRYDPVTDMGGTEWRKANPTFDGRGVTIAMIDQSMDAFLPELQVATTLAGAPTRKIVGYRTVVDIDEENDGQWFRMKDTVSATGGKISWNGKTYAAPADGKYRIDQLDEAVFDSLNRAGIEKDVNRDGNPPGSSRLFGILWNETTNDVWVDTDQDNDFSDEKAYTDYSVRPEFGTIGKDKPETPIRESVSFAIQTDKARKLVALNLGVASHASLVVGAAVASRGKAGRFDGVAPGAQLVNMAEGGAAYGQTEAVIEAAKIPEVDIIFTEQSSVITRNYLLFDGRLVPTVIYGRVIEKYGKSLVIPTHNYAVLAAIDDYALTPGAISIGGHESKANFFANHGVRVQHDDNLLITGGYGPMGNGALKPDIIAPSNYVSTGRGFLEGTAIPGLMQLPPGYNIAGGTSTATPTTAGAVALLLSAARQSNVKVDPFRLRHAIMTSGRWVPHIAANKQGNGVVNIAGAWEALKALDTVKTAITITSKAGVKHATSHLLATPHEGVGIFEREGWKTGDRAERTMTFTRTTGPKGALPFTIGWNGNDGTFTSATTVSLPLGTPVPVTVGIAPKSDGVHTAIMTLDYAGSPGVEYRTQATVVAATVLDASNKFMNEQKLEVPRPGMTHLYYRVPEGTSALRIDIDASKRGVTLAVTRPDTRNIQGLGMGLVTKGTFAIQDPVAGVWEVRLQDVDDTRNFDWQQAKKTEHVPNTAVTIKVTALDAGASTSTAIAANGSGSTTMDVDLTNRMGSFPGTALSMPMGAVRRDAGQLAESAQKVYDIDVPAGTTTLAARLRVTQGSAADVDIYLFDCSGKECVASKADGDATGDEIVMVQNPAAGKWKVVVDASRAATPAAYAYEDVVFNPAFGHVAVTDQPKDRDIGATWSAKGQAWVASIPTGREPFAAVQIQAQPKGATPFLVGLRELQTRIDRATGNNGTR